MSAYYNEIDPYAAQWLRNLISAGHIAPGDVDERSIVDVRADDLRGYTQCHFFAGVGGWSLALRLAGWPDDRPVWTGSCPCQPFSVAGEGKAADDERHLWPAWFPLIAECRPAIVFGEQVEAAIGWGWLDAVFVDLEGEGYACGTAVLPACGIGAPHIRQRCWLVAMDDASSERWSPQRHNHAQHERILFAADGSGGVANTGRASGLAEQRNQPGRGLGRRAAPADGAGPWKRGGANELADADRNGRDQERRIIPASRNDGAFRDCPHCRGYGWVLPNFSANFTVPCERCGTTGRVGDTKDVGRQRRSGSNAKGYRETAISGQHSSDRRMCELGNTSSLRLPSRQRGELSGSFEFDEGRATQQPSRSPWADCDWLPCTDGKARPVEPGTFPLAHGIPGRVGRLRAYGNAIIPQVAAQFIAASIAS
jgi:DNA (cytosine-5)-methyltransferase 1